MSRWRNRNNSVNVDKLNRIHPFYMVYIGEDGEIVCDYLNPKKMLDTIRYAKRVYYDNKREWNKIIDRAMAVDFSWNNSARKYEDLYNRM